MQKRLSQINLFFSTPIWTSKIENFIDLNNKLLLYVKDLQIKDPDGIKKSNLKGWHSPNFNLSDEVPKFFINSIGVSINESLLDMGWDLKNQSIKISSMWSIINKSNATNAPHIHSNSFISAAYYLKAPNHCGNINFNDPRREPTFFHPKISESNKLNINEVSITPEEGLLVLFPSYLQHSVSSNNSKEERIVISFNLNLI